MSERALKLTHAYSCNGCGSRAVPHAEIGKYDGYGAATVCRACLLAALAMLDAAAPDVRARRTSDGTVSVQCCNGWVPIDRTCSCGRRAAP